METLQLAHARFLGITNCHAVATSDNAWRNTKLAQQFIESNSGSLHPISTFRSVVTGLKFQVEEAKKKTGLIHNAKSNQGIQRKGEYQRRDRS